MRRGDLSVDLILEREDPRPQGLLGKLIRSVSRSIERITEPRRVVYDIEKVNFAKFLTQEAFPRHRKAPTLDRPLYSEFELNQVDALKTEKLNFLDYLKSLRGRLGEGGPAEAPSRDLTTFLLQRRRKLVQHLDAYRRLDGFVRANEQSLDLLAQEVQARRVKTENLRFDKVKDFESRGRTLIKIKNIEVVLQVINKNDLSVPAETTARLIAHRSELIALLRQTIDTRRRLDQLRKQRAFEEELALLRKTLHNLNLKNSF